MPVFAYRALNKSGRTVRGVVDAETPLKARQRLRSEGLHPVEIKPTGGGREAGAGAGGLLRFIPRPKSRLGPLAEITRQTATLLSAGLPLITALSAIQEQTEDEEYRRLLALVREDVQGGESLASALGRHSEAFPVEYVHLIRAGELAGELDTVLDRLAGDLEVRLNRRARISAALAYPAFMTVVGSAVVVFLLTFIVPTLAGLFQDMKAALPWPTRMLLATAGFMRAWWWLLLPLAAGLVVLAGRFLGKPERYRRIELLFFRLGPAGALYRKMKLARVFRSLAVMVAGGVPLTGALAVTAQGQGKSNFGAALETAAEMVGRGHSLTEALTQSGLFPPVARRMVAVGEQSGALDEMLQRIAQSYEDETDRALSALTSLVEPAIILVMGLIVGFIVLAILLPIFDLSGLVG